MSKAGDRYENPVTGEYGYTRIGTEDTGGKLLVSDLRVRPGGAVLGAHLHPTIDERFTVVSAVSYTHLLFLCPTIDLHLLGQLQALGAAVAAGGGHVRPASRPDAGPGGAAHDSAGDDHRLRQHRRLQPLHPQHDAGAVSYTHLDVYKRQHLNRHTGSRRRSASWSATSSRRLSERHTPFGWR